MTGDWLMLILMVVLGVPAVLLLIWLVLGLMWALLVFAAETVIWVDRKMGDHWKITS